MTDTITIIGNLAAEPEQRVMPSGGTVTNFRVGTTHRRFDKPSEQWVDSYTNWYQVSAFRALGENVYASLHKGDRVIVSGRLRLREWDNGTKRGLAVDLDAEAVGHDLLWGRTVFEKSAMRGAAQSGETATPQESADGDQRFSPTLPVVAATDADGWAIPAAAPALSDTPF